LRLGKMDCATGLDFVSDPQTRIADYQRRADEAIAAAEGTSDPILGQHYMRLAETYLQLIEMELRRIELRKPLDLPP